MACLGLATGAVARYWVRARRGIVRNRKLLHAVTLGNRSIYHDGWLEGSMRMGTGGIRVVVGRHAAAGACRAGRLRRRRRARAERLASSDESGV